MERTTRTVVPIACLLALGGCRAFTSPARTRQIPNPETVTWIDYDASRRGSFVIPAGSNVKLVSEPSPDVALGMVVDALAKVSYSGVEGSASVKVTETVTELGKRTQTIMFLREALFRLEQMSVNNSLSATQQLEVYNKVLDASLLLAKSDHNATEAKRLEAEQELQRINLETMKIQQGLRPVPEPGGPR